jgi:hypothetical protein
MAVDIGVRFLINTRSVMGQERTCAEPSPPRSADHSRADVDPKLRDVRDGPKADPKTHVASSQLTDSERTACVSRGAQPVFERKNGLNSFPRSMLLDTPAIRYGGNL